MGLQIHLCESLLSHIRALSESSVQWVYTKKEVSNMEIAYIKCGDYYIPDLTLPEEPRPMGSPSLPLGEPAGYAGLAIGL